MLNEKKIRLMTSLAHYEGEEGKEDLPISGFYRNDYIGIGLLKNALLTTGGYLLLWAMVIVYNLDFVLDNLHKMDLSIIIWEFVVGYILILVLYSILTYVKRFSRYQKAKKNVKIYYQRLGQLAEIYGEKDQKIKNKELLGGKRR